MYVEKCEKLLETFSKTHFAKVIKGKRELLMTYQMRLNSLNCLLQNLG